MKKLVVLLFPLLMVIALNAVDFGIDGEFRTRAAMYNDMFENNGGHIDNRLLLNLTANIHPSLKVIYGIEVGDIRWGDAPTGGHVTTDGINVETELMYLDYQMKLMNLNLKLGQQYWADHRSLVLDDTFSGVMLSTDDLMGFNAEFGYLKATENVPSVNDDHHVFVASLATQKKNIGVQAFYGNDMRIGRTANLTFLPYVNLPVGPLTLDATAILDYQVNNDADEEIGYGAAFKADMKLGPLAVNGDILYLGENGVTTLSPYYQNGLYLFGWGQWHDGVTVDFPYPYGDNGMLSAVAGARFSPCGKNALFAHAGYVTTFADDDPGVGIEVNAGLEYNLIPDLANIAAYGAIALPGDHLAGSADMLYMFGSTVKVNF